MPKCDCCHQNDGTNTQSQRMPVGTWQAGTVSKKVTTVRLCDACNDGQFPFYDPKSGAQACPHGV